MSSHEPPAPFVDSDGLRFELVVYPEKSLRPWRAELLEAGGGRRTFATPLELIRHLARLGLIPASHGGLR